MITAGRAVVCFQAKPNLVVRFVRDWMQTFRVVRDNIMNQLAQSVHIFCSISNGDPRTGRGFIRSPQPQYFKNRPPQSLTTHFPIHHST
jgi:hypothetical protein